jgi:hypothetical protein
LTRIHRVKRSNFKPTGCPPFGERLSPEQRLSASVFIRVHPWFK